MFAVVPIMDLCQNIESNDNEVIIVKYNYQNPKQNKKGLIFIR